MAAEILRALIEANLAAAAAILLVLALRRPLRRIAGPRLSYRAWLIVPLAAAATFLPPRVIPVTVPAAEAVTLPWIGGGAQQAGAAPIDLASLALAAWALGTVLCLILFAVLQHRSVRKLGPLVHTSSKRTVRARKGGFGPAVVGALIPKIVLPADFETRFGPKERTVILAHEKVHLEEGDAQANAFVVLCQSLCWFNPLVHLAAFHVRLDQELACDAAVMARYPEARRSYAEAMLKTQLAGAPLPLGCYWPARSEHPLKERLAMLKTTPPTRARKLAGAAAILTLALGAGLSAWAAQPPESRDAFIDVKMDTDRLVPSQGKATHQVPLANQGFGEDEFVPVQARPRPLAQGPRPAPQAAPTATDVCLSNSCATPAPTGPSAAPTPLTGPPANAPPNSFVAKFNANAPVLIRGKVTGIEWGDPNSYFRVTTNDGRQFRVEGSAQSTMPAGMREGFEASIGSELIVRGYQAWDTSCNGGCLVNGRDVTFLDGRRVFVGQPGTQPGGPPADGTEPRPTAPSAP